MKNTEGIGKLLIILDSSVGSAHFLMYWSSGRTLECLFLSSFINLNSSYFFSCLIFLIEFINLDIDSYLSMHYLFLFFCFFFLIIFIAPYSQQCVNLIWNFIISFGHTSAAHRSCRQASVSLDKVIIAYSY